MLERKQDPNVPRGRPKLALPACIASLSLLAAGLGFTLGTSSALSDSAIAASTELERLEPPADGVMGFVVEEFHLPILQDKAACPNGTVPRLRDAYVESLPPAERKRLRLEENKKELDQRWRSYAFGPDGTNVCTHPDMFDRPVMKAVESPLAWGLDLDGDAGSGESGANGCAQQDFTSPAGELGIDNQEYRALGCTLEWRGVDGVAGDMVTGMKQHLTSGEWAQVILLRSVDSLVHDDDVEVIYANTSDRPYIDNDGNFLPGATFTITEDAARRRNVLKGKIENGVLTTEPARIELAQTWGQGGARDIRGNRTKYDFHEGRLRLTFQPDGSLEGMLGGYKPLFGTIYAPALGGAGSALVAGMDCAAYLATVKHYADGLRNPETGQCEGISSAQRIVAIPAFVNDVTTRQRTAAR